MRNVIRRKKQREEREIEIEREDKRYREIERWEMERKKERGGKTR